MSDQSNTVEVSILDKTYLVACPDEAKDALIRAALYLDEKMREIKATGKIYGTDRIAVMAALNISHELMQSQAGDQSYKTLLETLNSQLDEKLSRIPS